MVGGVEGTGGGQDPTQSSGDPQQVQTGMSKMYTSQSAPGFAQMLQYWYPDCSEEEVSAFEQNVMQMIQNSMNQSKSEHEKVQQKIKERINEG